MWSAKLRDETGFTLIEVLIAALLVVVVSLGTLAALDSASATSGRERARAQAASLVQQDQEDIRATSPSALANAAGTTTTRNVTVGNFQFTVTRTIQWKSDQSSASATCSGSSPPSYVQVTTTVGGPSLHGLKPPKSDTLVAMPAGSTGGALQVTVSDSGGGPVQFVNVNATSTTGGGTQTAQTNASGCALFTTLPNGTYDVTAQKTGYIDRNGNAAPKVSAQHVFAGQTRSVAFTMEQAGWLSVTFWTNANGWTQTTSPDQQWDRVTTTSGGVTRICGTPRVANGVAAVTTSLLTKPCDNTPGSAGLWPGNYTVLPGECINEQYPATGFGATVTKGAQSTVDVYLRPLFPTLKWAGSAASGIHARFVRTADCAVQFSTPDLGPTDNSGHITQFVGVPPGNYYVCAWYTDTSQTPNKTYYVRSALKAVGTYASVPQAAVTTTVSLSTGSPTTPTSPC